MRNTVSSLDSTVHPLRLSWSSLDRTNSFTGAPLTYGVWRSSSKRAGVRSKSHVRSRSSVIEIVGPQPMAPASARESGIHLVIGPLDLDTRIGLDATPNANRGQIRLMQRTCLATKSCRSQ